MIVGLSELMLQAWLGMEQAHNASFSLDERNTIALTFFDSILSK